jgi:hypothetical protein
MGSVEDIQGFRELWRSSRGNERVNFQIIAAELITLSELQMKCDSDQWMISGRRIRC